MKKLFVLIITLIMIVSTVVFAEPETIDLATMTQNELNDLLNRVNYELRRFWPEGEIGSVILDYNGIVVKYKGLDFSEKYGLVFDLIIENYTQNTVIVSSDKVYLNGYPVETLMGANVYSGKKNSGIILVLNAEDDAGVSSRRDLRHIEFVLKILDPSDNSTLYESDEIFIYL